jgi:hypothetical protein
LPLRHVGLPDSLEVNVHARSTPWRNDTGWESGVPKAHGFPESDGRRGCAPLMEALLYWPDMFAAVALLLMLDVPPPASAASCARARNVTLRAENVAMTCEHGHHDCSGVVQVVVVNCRAKAVRLERLEIIPVPAKTKPTAATPKEATTLEPAPENAEIPPRSRRAFPVRVTDEQVALVKGRILPAAAGDRPPILPRPIRIRVTNPARDAAVKACRACKGEWGAHGLSQMEGCICRTKDAGRICHGGDCEGACLYRETVDGKPQGRCAELRTTLGCQERITRSADGQIAIHNVCVD